jgi:hypothetical protein
MWFQNFQIPDGAEADWLNLCADNGFAVVNPNRIPAPIPSGLLAKCDSALVIRSGSLTDGLVYIMANLNRQDHGQIDQMPFGIAIVSGSNFTSGALMHHGDYSPDRTTQGSPVTRSYFTLTPDQESRLTSSFSFSQLPAAETGPLASLGVRSQWDALNALMAELQPQISGWQSANSPPTTEAAAAPASGSEPVADSGSESGATDGTTP